MLLLLTVRDYFSFPAEGSLLVVLLHESFALQALIYIQHSLSNLIDYIHSYTLQILLNVNYFLQNKIVQNACFYIVLFYIKIRYFT